MLRVLGKMGVERIFASPGSEWSPLWEALAEPGVEGMPIFMSTRHEEIAVGMAGDIARRRYKLPAVVIHTTVGALHATMAMRGIAMSKCRWLSSPESRSVLARTRPIPGDNGEAISGMGGPAKLVDHTWSFGINTKSILPATIQRACRLAMVEVRGVPFFCRCPWNTLRDDDQGCPRIWAPRRLPPPTRKASKSWRICWPGQRTR